MRARPTLPAWIALAVMCLALGAPWARADGVADEAEVQFRLGSRSYEARDYEQALAHFLTSDRLARNRNVLFNIALCYEHLAQFPEAYRYYTSSLLGETDHAVAARVEAALARVAPRVAALRITTEPARARIYLERKDLGEQGLAPLTLALLGGQYRLIAELDGYEDAVSDPVDVRIGVETAVTLRLKRIVGSIRVAGPSGAVVRLDADNAPVACRAPCDVAVAPGQHFVIVSAPGYRTARLPVSVGADQVSTVAADLVAETGTLIVNTDEPGAQILVDDFAHGVTPAIVPLPVGKHRVRVSLRGFDSIEREVSIATRGQTRLDLELETSDVVEAASRASESAEEAPASVSLVTSQELRGMSYPTVAEAVRGVRGLYLSDDRAYQILGFRGLALPGSYGNRALVTLDGVPLNDDYIWSSYIGYDLRTDLEDIERIEVVRGPGSVVYGTSAFSGVVNLVTRWKDAPAQSEVGLSVAGEGVARARGRLLSHFARDAGVWASVAAGTSRGRDFFFPEYVADGPPEVAGHARGLDGARFGTLTGRLWWRELSLAWSLHHHDKHLPTGQYDTVFGDGRARQSDTRSFVEARFEHALSASATSLSRVHLNQYAYRGHGPGFPEDGGIDTNRFTSYWVGVEQRFAFVPSPVVNANVGSEFQTHPRAHTIGETETDGRYFNATQDFLVAAFYGDLDWRLGRAWKVSAGGRFDYYSSFGSSFNPRLALIAKPYRGSNLKLLLSKAFKAPSVLESSYKAVSQEPNPDLEPENIYSAEIEFSQRWSPKIVATVAVFANYVTDLILLRAVPPGLGADATQYQNVDTPVGTLGGEVELRRDWKSGWMFAGSYSLQRSTYLASSNLSDLFALRQSPAFREVPNSPVHLASLKAAAPILARALSVMTRLTLEDGRYDTTDAADDPTPQTKTEPALLWDFVLTGNERRLGLNYSLGVYNAFDWPASHPVSTEFRQRSIPITGRSFLAAANYTF